MLKWLPKNIQIIDVNYLGKWYGPKMNLPQMNSRWRKCFAWYPVKLDSNEIVFFKYYWVYESYMQNPYNGAKGFIIQEKISENDKVLHNLRK